MTTDYNVDIDSYYVFVARFDDGRMKDKIRFVSSDSVTEAESSLEDDWASRDDVYLDSLGRFSKFYMLAPQLNYDLRTEVDIPTSLLRAIGGETVSRILHVASTDSGWEEMPSRETLLSTDPSFAVISENYADEDPVASSERSLLTDKLLVFRNRIRRAVTSDFVDYNRLDVHPPSQFGLLKNDGSALRILRRLERTRHSVDQDDYAFVGVLLTRSGCPATSIDTWSTPKTDVDGHPSLHDHPEYDLVLYADSDWSRRTTQHHALNTVNRWIQWSSEPGYYHRWYSVSTPTNSSASSVVVYARNKSHACRKAKHLLPEPASLNDLLAAGVSRLSDVDLSGVSPGTVIVDREISETHIPPGISESAADSMLSGKG